MLELRLPVARVERPGRHEEQQLAVGAEGRLGHREPAVGGRGRLLRLERKQVNPPHVLVFGLHVGKPPAVGRPRVVVDAARRRLRHQRHRLAVHVHDVQALFPVGPRDLAAVRRPGRRELVGVTAAGQLHRRALAVLRDDPDLVFAGAVRDVGDPLAVGRPLRVALVHTWRAREVPRRAVLGRDGEDIAAGAEERAAAVRRDLVVGHAAAHVHLLGAAAVEVLGDRHRDLDRLLGGQVEAVDVAAVLEDDGVVAQRGELDVVLREVGKLPGLPRPQVVAVQVQPRRLIPVGGEVDPAALPHRDDVEGRVAGQVRRRLRLEVVEPHVVRHPAAVALPGAELAEHAVVDELGPVGRVRTKAAARQRQFFDRPAVHVREIQLPEEVVPLGAPRSEQHVAGVLPAKDDVVGTHAVGDVVAPERGRPGEALRHAALRRHQVDLGVAVVLPREGQPLPVRREAGEHLETDVAREPAGDAARGGDGVEVAGIGEDHLVAVHGGETEQARLRGLLGDGPGTRGGQDEQQRERQRSLHGMRVYRRYD